MSAEFVTKDVLSSVSNRMHGMLQTRLGQFESQFDSQIRTLENRLTGQLQELERRLSDSSRGSLPQRPMNEVLDEMISLRTGLDEVLRRTDPRIENTRKQDDQKMMQTCLAEVESTKYKVERLKGQVEVMDKQMYEFLGGQMETSHLESRLLGDIESRLSAARELWANTSQKSLAHGGNGLDKRFANTHTPGPARSFTSARKPLNLSSGREQVYEFDRRNGLGLGLELRPGVGKTGLVIVQIFGWGLVGKWNESHPGQTIREGDTIPQINDVRGDSGRLLDELAKKDVLRVMVVHSDSNIATTEI